MLAKLAIEKVPCLSSLVMLGIAALYDFVKKTVLTEEARRQSSMGSPETSLFHQDKTVRQGWCSTRLSSNLDFGMDQGSEFECGFKTNMDAQVLSTNDVLIPGLHAAGLTGLFYHEYPPATSALRSLTFGRIAGTAIAKSCEQVICGEFVSW